MELSAGIPDIIEEEEREGLNTITYVSVCAVPYQPAAVVVLDARRR